MCAYVSVCLILLHYRYLADSAHGVVHCFFFFLLGGRVFYIKVHGCDICFFLRL